MQKINVVVMTLAGMLLIVAAALKAHEVLTVYFPSWREQGIWESWEFFLVQIPVEFALGVWMVSGLFRKAAWLVGTVAYFGFIGVTLYKGLTGAESCGCFGRIEVDPWITLFTIDIPFALLLAAFRPKGLKLLPPPWPNVGHAFAAAVPIFAALIFSTPLLVAFRPDFIKPEDWTPQTPVTRPAPEPDKPAVIGPAVVVEPIPEPEPPQETPEPKPGPEPEPEVEAPPQWPWLEHIDIAEQLTEGIVVVYLYHHDCSICADSVPKYEAYRNEMTEMGVEEIKIAYVAIPPYGKAGTGPVPPDTTALTGKLTDQRKWAITSPFVVALIEGSVVKTWPEGSAPNPDNILDEIFAP